MKKIISASLLALSFCALGYTSEDVSNAHYLGDQGIVTKQTVASKYRLDDKILRQEVITMALKVKGIALPENYKCKKYFADVLSSSDWVCRTIEIAADNGIITRSNKNANPGKYVTRAEALAMIMRAGGLNPEDLPAGGGVYSDATVGWQGIIIDAASKFGILEKDNYYMKRTDFSGEVMDDGMQMIFSPNRLATRTEVFNFTRNILGKGNSSGSQDTFDENEVIKRVIGISGGTLTNASGEFTVTIPAGAVQKDTEFTLSFKKSSFKVVSGTGSPITFSLSPSETSFSEAVSIKISYNPTYRLLVPYFVDQDGKLQNAQLRNIDKTNHTFTMDTFHGGDYSWIYIQ